ncbi:MAG TPA: hypothetical protein VIN07_11555 [Flavipsychrobacter sp.]
MRTALLYLLFCLLAIPAYTQEVEENLFAIVFDPVAKKDLEAVHIKDWQYRKYLVGMKDATRDSLAKAFRIKPDAVEEHLDKMQAVNDSENLAVVARIIRTSDAYYPGKSLVGEPTHLVALSVIMHANQEQKYYPRVNQAFTMGEVPQFAVAMLEDHILAEKGWPQNYGSHYTRVRMRDEATNKIVTRYYISPVKSPDHINERRKSKGFDATIEEYARQSGVIYDPTLTAEKLKQMRVE